VTRAAARYLAKVSENRVSQQRVGKTVMLLTPAQS
jgi:hypothetical protein